MSDHEYLDQEVWSRNKQLAWLHKNGASFDQDKGRRFGVYTLRRIVDRIFFGDPTGVLLKGGLAGRFRTEDARYTTDIDLHTSDVDMAIDHLMDSLRLDLNDSLKLEFPSRWDDCKLTSTKGHKTLVTIKLVAVWGTREERNPVKIEIAQELPVQSVSTPRPGLLLPPSGLPVGNIALYPLPEQIAQKVAACIEVVKGQPSSRTKDLVDICIFALTETIERPALLNALATEFEQRELRWPDVFQPPERMKLDYLKVTKNSASKTLPKSFDAAKDLAAKFLWLQGSSDPNLKWDPEKLVWE